MNLNKYNIKENKLRQAYYVYSESIDEHRKTANAYIRSKNIIKGYKRYFELSETIKLRPDHENFKLILELLNKQQYSNYFNFIDSKDLTLNEISEECYNLNISNPYWGNFFKKYFTKKKYFSYTSSITHKSIYSYTYAFVWKEAFTIVVKPIYISSSSIRYINSTSSKKLSESKAYFNTLGGWNAWMKIHKGYVNKDSCWEENARLAKLSRQSQCSYNKKNIKKYLRKNLSLKEIEFEH